MAKKLCYLVFILFLYHANTYSQTQTSTGTGFFINGNGVIVTCYHVIEDADQIFIQIGNTNYPAEIISIMSDKDLALIKIDYVNPYYFHLADFETMTLGDKVYVLGFPLSDILGSDIRLTDGIISARSGINSDPTYFQISAPVQPGNSGGPIFNESFAIIGVAAHKLSDMATLVSSGVIPQNINFGVKSNHISDLLDGPTSLYPSIRTPGNNTFRSNIVQNMSQAIEATVHINSTKSERRNASSIHIANRTGYTIFYLYVSPATSTSWGIDRLGTNVLMNGQDFTVSSLDFSPGSLWDIMLIDLDNDTYTMNGISLTSNQTIEFTFNDIDGINSSANYYSSQYPEGQTTQTGSTDYITIDNNTGYTIFFVYVSPSSSDSWGTDLLRDDVLLNGYSVRVSLPQNHNNQYDIKLIDIDNDSYTKMNVRLTRNQRIEFTIMDIDL
ncbi:MAG: serine protease [Candidatus Cloacimonetes bacterium]|nr:serine protease [Candidatus Cloacimonadota bacterium]